MRILTILVATTSLAHANPTTQQCLGNIDAFLACPAGTQRAGTECRARGDHWSGSKRQGPAVFMRDDNKTVSFAANYKDHKKTGRVFRFDSQGRLASWNDTKEDKWHGVSVQCLPDGRVLHVAYYDHNNVTGVSRSWRASDGAFSYAMQYDAQGNAKSITASADMQKRPDHLCQPQRCDVTAAPDLYGPAPSQSSKRSSRASASSTEPVR